MRRRSRVLLLLLLAVAAAFAALRGCRNDAGERSDRDRGDAVSTDVMQDPQPATRPPAPASPERAPATAVDTAMIDTIPVAMIPAETPVRAVYDTIPALEASARLLSLTDAAAVIVKGLPRTYQVVSVPVPEAFAQAERVDYTVEARSGFAILGRRSGRLNPDTHGSALVTIGFPANARAGHTTAAAIVFAADEDGVVIPIVAEVTPVRRLALAGATRIDALEPGQRFDLKFTVANIGNASDTVRAEVTGPDGWRGTRTSFSPVVIEPGAEHEFATRVEVPNRSGTGGFFFRVRAVGADAGTLQERIVTVAVGDRLSDGAPPGPVLRAGFGSVSIDGREPDGIAHVSITGPVASEVFIDARAATRPELESNAVRGLNRVGAYFSEPRLSLWSPTWRFDAGSTVTRFTDLTGVNAGATGVSFLYDGPAYEAGLLLGRPFSSVASDDGHLAGVRAGMAVGPARIAASVTSLDAQSVTHQQLTAAGVQGSLDAFGLGRLGTELAWREYASGSGLGWGVNFVERSDRGHVDVRYVHAPGGSGAFARAVDEVAVSADRSFGRFNLSGSLLSASDRNAAFDELDSNAWSLTPQYRITDNTSVRLSVRGYDYDVRGTTSFGSSEAGVAAGLTSQVGKLFYSAEAGVERYTRSITLGDDEFDASAPRYSWRGGASYVMPYGVLQLETAYDRTTDGSLSPEQLLLLLRADRMRFRFLPSAMYVTAEATHQRWGGARSLFGARLGAVYATPFDFEIAASIERNPLAAGFSGRTPIVFALRVDRVLSLPRMPLGTERGRVFQDLNGNGRWDRDEPGAARVVVRRRNVRAVTGRDGTYTFWEPQPDAPVEVDAATLPHGWVIAGHAATARDIPLTAISTVIVTLQLGPAERARSVDVSEAVVIARDETGREWIARRSGPDTALFDALPAGTYTLDFNFSSSGEPLRPDRSYTVTVTGNSTENVIVRLQGRPLRFRDSGG